MSYLDEAGIRSAFAEHLMKYKDYSDAEVAIAVSDFPDRYSLPYLDEEYIGEEIIDGVEYEKNACITDFQSCGIEGIPAFKFYSFYAVEDIPNHLVSEYMAARKLYQADDLYEGDFPAEDCESL